MKVILETQAGGSYEFDGIFVMREHVAPKTLVPGLKTEENRYWYSVTCQLISKDFLRVEI